MTAQNSVQDRVTLEAAEFVSIWKGDSEARTKTPAYFIDDLSPSGEPVATVSLKNLTVNGNIYLADISSPLVTLHLEDVHFKYIEIKNCKTNHINITGGSIIGNIEIQGESTY